MGGKGVLPPLWEYVLSSLWPPPPAPHVALQQPLCGHRQEDTQGEEVAEAAGRGGGPAGEAGLAANGRD